MSKLTGVALILLVCSVGLSYAEEVQYPVSKQRFGDVLDKLIKIGVNTYEAATKDGKYCINFYSEPNLKGTKATVCKLKKGVAYDISMVPINAQSAEMADDSFVPFYITLCEYSDCKAHFENSYHYKWTCRSSLSCDNFLDSGRKWIQEGDIAAFGFKSNFND